ncbi:GyrI-like domain-containing protein [Winogradskyella marincola]|uniref:GyrI-like domain-containing protein n=1 Tax=Winogradskyella marincola TaxID=3037795 RepID=A0ABT6G0Y2_9FLAO|nr:GyrI-like domain-containing protein [Winogradskyella sp. YYF002]MDG4715701.1 GyrI-like domain-containing protein [Winogradskyella sp. YYF002]
MQPKIVALTEKKVVGMQSKMLMHQYENIIKLWKSFMPKKHELKNTINQELIAIQDYPDFGNLETSYNIWACAEVSDFINIPDSMQPFTISEGLYAVFLHKGMDAGKTYQRIMTEWLPNSGYNIDDRPHFQVMGDKYKNGSPDSEEDFYIPVIMTT